LRSNIQKTVIKLAQRGNLNALKRERTPRHSYARTRNILNYIITW